METKELSLAGCSEPAKPRTLRGVRVWKRQAWFWVPALGALATVCWVVNNLPLAYWLGYWQAFGVKMVGSVLAGLLCGLLGRFFCYLRADGRGPWVVVDDSTVKPASFYDTAMYQPVGTGYAGYLCGPACVPPSHVYGSWDEAHNAIHVLEEAHANIAFAARTSFRLYKDEEWRRALVHLLQQRPEKGPGFIVMPYYE